MSLNILGPAWRDLHYATRVLRKRPAFTITSVLTLALCIGANTAIFSVVDSVLLRPLPYPQPDALFDVITTLHGQGVDGEQDSQTGSTWFAIHDNASDLDSAVVGGSMGVNLATHGKAQYVQQHRVSAGFFRVLGIHPLLGREISPGEDRSGGPPVALLSYPLWRHAFAGDPSIVGSSITLRGEPYTVVGVMPPGFQTNVATDVWTPLRPNTTGEGSGQNYEVIGRLKPGVSWAEAEAQIAVVGESALKQAGYRAGITAQLHLTPLKRGWTSDVRKPLLILWSTVAAVLLIGCVNIAGLLLARSSERTREIATRMAIGSGRAAVLRQLLAESVVLAAMGGIAGIAMGYAGLSGLKWLAVSTFESWETISLDPRVLTVAAGVSLFTSLIFGLIPALQASRIDIRSALSEGGTRGVAGGSHRLRGILVAGEVALGVMLLVGAGLLIRTFAYLQGLNPGFDGRNVITAKVSLQDARYNTSEAITRLFDQSLQRIKQIPGVESAAVGLALPYERGLNMGIRRLDGPHVDSRGAITDLGYVTPEYFEALRIPLHRGRVFRPADSTASQQVALVNEAFVRKYLAEQDALGSHIMTNNIARAIVGVVGDVQQKPGWGPTSPIAPIPAVYVPAAQAPAGLFRTAHTWFSPSWIVRTSSSQHVPQPGIISGMQHAMEATDPQLPFAGFRSMTDVQFRSLAFQRLQATLLGMLGGLALLLAAVGIYGLIASSVAERTRELGIRLALGATSGQAMRTIVAPGIALTLIGVAVGCVLARLLVRVMQHIVFGVTPGDPLTFAAVAIILIAVAAIASAVPALRVLRLDPSQTLRHE